MSTTHIVMGGAAAKSGRLGLLSALGLATLGYSSVAIAGAYNYNDAILYYHDASGYHADGTLCAPTASTLSGSCGVSGVDVKISSSASTDGVVHASAQTTLTNFTAHLTTPEPSAHDSGTLSYGTDVLYGSVAFGGTVPATLVFYYQVNGQVSSVAVDATTLLGSGYYVSLGTDQSGYETYQNRNPVFGATDTAVSQYGTLDVPVKGSSKVGFEIVFEAIDQLRNATGTDLSGTVTANFSDTASFGVEALDSSGNNITNATDLEFFGLSLPGGISVPEPSAWTMMLLGVWAVGTGLRARRFAWTKRRAL